MPVSLWRPSGDRLRRFLAAQRDSPPSYRPVGSSRSAPPGPAGFVLDHRRIRLGQGERDFGFARDAVRRWQMFALGWVELCWPAAAIRAGTEVAVLARVAGLYWLNACRIVYVVDDPERFGFAYGTLAAHAERGEERFLVELDREGGVWYDLLAFSRPALPLVWAAYPVARRLQHRFAVDSLRAMVRAVATARAEEA